MLAACRRRRVGVFQSADWPAPGIEGGSAVLSGDRDLVGSGPPVMTDEIGGPLALAMLVVASVKARTARSGGVS